MNFWNKGLCHADSFVHSLYLHIPRKLQEKHE